MATLTYAPEHVPANGSLDKSHLRDFWKRARKRFGKMRYLAAGEYGPRPHYHCCIFGQDWSHDWKQIQHERPLYTSPSLEETWGKGFVSIAPLNFETAAYVARYTLKKQLRHDDEQYRRIDLETGEEFYVEPEFATMSRRPGIGAAWFDKYVDDLYPRDECVVEGRKFAVPRYYDKLLERQDESKLDQVKLDRFERRKEDVRSEKDRWKDQDNRHAANERQQQQERMIS